MQQIVHIQQVLENFSVFYLQISFVIPLKIFAHHTTHWNVDSMKIPTDCVRQYFPKGLGFATINNDNVQYVEDLLNNRPRKTLNYKTANEVAAHANSQQPKLCTSLLNVR